MLPIRRTIPLDGHPPTRLERADQDELDADYKQAVEEQVERQLKLERERHEKFFQIMRIATIRILSTERGFLGGKRHRCKVEFCHRPVMVEGLVDTKIYESMKQAFKAVEQWLVEGTILEPDEALDLQSR